MLKGEYSHNIDAKGRLIIPAKFRDDLGEHFVITKGMENCLYVYPEDEWNTFEEKLNALPTTTDKKARAFAYFFQGSATDGDLDKQGRTLIPSVLREYAKLGKITKTEIAIIESPVARPSNPSVKFTALLPAVNIKYTKIGYNHPISISICNKGIEIAVSNPGIKNLAKI